MAVVAPSEYGGITMAHFDIPWLPSCIAQCIFFYNFPCSKSHFLDNITRFLLTIAESANEDFADLTGNHAREAHRFHAFVPELPLATNKLFSVQISFFPNQGFCIDFISKLKGDGSHLLRKRHDLPFYDRSNVEDPNGLDSIYWNQVMKNLIPCTYYIHA
ncbi:hypothetical protein ACJIZ3_007660 [Penstemon smallii]|uniref:Uncharacterized protein n=1 Tax=Penstemon smallii TaxID=265156 RepID=A0ABD3T7L2_9LAMI